MCVFFSPLDTDECCLGTYCHIQSTCANSVGSFQCSCKEGFTGNGTYCEGTYNYIVNQENKFCFSFSPEFMLNQNDETLEE